MPLDRVTEQRIRAEAKRRGVDEEAAVAEAQKHASAPTADSTATDSPTASTGGKPIFERFLLGALPFVTVREFRTEWLGLTDRIPDDEMITGDFLKIHGSALSSAPAPGEPAP